MSMIHADKHLEEQPNLNLNPYIKLTELTKEEIEQYTGQ